MARHGIRPRMNIHGEIIECEILREGEIVGRARRWHRFPAHITRARANEDERAWAREIAEALDRTEGCGEEILRLIDAYGVMRRTVMEIARIRREDRDAVPYRLHAAVDEAVEAVRKCGRIIRREDP